MFEHFTFAAQAQTQQDDLLASPTDLSFPSPLSPPPSSFSPTQLDGLSDIVNKFSKQSLYPETENESPQQSIWQGREEDESSMLVVDHDMEPFSPTEFTYISTSKGMMTINSMESLSLSNAPTPPHPKSGTVASRRLQRQLHVQLQSCSNHARNINALVEDMIVSNTQCRLYKSPSRPRPRPRLSSPPLCRLPEEDLVVDTTESFQEPAPFEDEGFAEIDDAMWGIEEEMSLRRASTPSGIRKYINVKWRSSAEVGAAGPVVGSNGRMKVRNVPRMRRRKVKSVPE
jgi:hypothetical protein